MSVDVVTGSAACASLNLPDGTHTNVTHCKIEYQLLVATELNILGVLSGFFVFRHQTLHRSTFSTLVNESYFFCVCTYMSGTGKKSCMLVFAGTRHVHRIMMENKNQPVSKASLKPYWFLTYHNPSSNKSSSVASPPSDPPRSTASSSASESDE